MPMEMLKTKIDHLLALALIRQVVLEKKMFEIVNNDVGRWTDGRKTMSIL